MRISDFVILLIVVIFGGGIFSAANAIDFYVGRRRPGRSKLESFKNELPTFLQTIYFNSANAYVYDGVSRVSGMEHLLREKSTVSILFKWTSLLIFCEGIILIVSYNDYSKDGNVSPLAIVLNVVSLTVFARTAFFGYRI